MHWPLWSSQEPVWPLQRLSAVFVAVVRVSCEAQAGVTQYSLWLSQGQVVLLLLIQPQLSSAMIQILWAWPRVFPRLTSIPESPCSSSRLGCWPPLASSPGSMQEHLKGSFCVTLKAKETWKPCLLLSFNMPHSWFMDLCPLEWAAGVPRD